MKTYVHLHVEQKMESLSFSKFVRSYEPQVSSAVKFDNDCDVIFMFRM